MLAQLKHGPRILSDLDKLLLLTTELLMQVFHNTYLVKLGIIGTTQETFFYLLQSIFISPLQNLRNKISFNLIQAFIP